MWLDNAIEEHGKNNFHALICRDNINQLSDIISKKEFDKENHSRWLNEKQKEVLSTPRDMASFLSPLLKTARILIFIEPYFDPKRPDFIRPFTEFFKVISDSSYWPRSKIQVEIHSGRNKGRGYGYDHYRNLCKDHLLDIIPPLLQVKFVRWDDTKGEAEIHHRYLLTDLGGIKLDPGFDERSRGAETEFLLLEDYYYKKKWSIKY
jgi:hypothetical protein